MMVLTIASFVGRYVYFGKSGVSFRK